MKYKWDPGHLADLIALYVDDIRAVSCIEEGCWKAMHMVSTLSAMRKTRPPCPW
jgi:hypothetical protein